jgi:hypothetical protein
MTQDPTREEMITFLQTWPFINEADEFDIEEALYWFASDWHSGQWSNLYSVLSTSEYQPSPIASGIDKDSMSYQLYQELKAEFCS